tara:strand:- start:448 stop:621 length:174 start_codon:yes stop_codon:yes gene_type:complete
MSKVSPTLRDLVDIQLEILRYAKKDGKIYHLCLQFFTTLASVTQDKIKKELEQGEDE